ncbi:hypothetical protein BS17DRAFT_37568 [Gyrodon lividus]|nr:hypothetical protein BS17DRAFT_37568 [Gyrodon lividus]
MRSFVDIRVNPRLTFCSSSRNWSWQQQLDLASRPRFPFRLRSIPILRPLVHSYAEGSVDWLDLYTSLESALLGVLAIIIPLPNQKEYQPMDDTAYLWKIEHA